MRPLGLEQETPLEPAEAAVLAHPAARLLGELGGPYRLRVAAQPPFRTEAPVVDNQPAAVEIAGDRVRVRHSRFLAELDPFARSAVFYRPTPNPGGLAITIRVAVSCQLPLSGWLPLHAAGVLLDGRGLVFFGPSGAGKSTLASTHDGDVLSDELVAVGGDPLRLTSLGIAGSLGESRSVAGSGPLVGLFSLAKAPELSLARLPLPEARRRLLEVVQVPAEARLWSAALGVLGRLLHLVPVHRMGWSPTSPPWDELRAFLAERGSPSP